MDVCGLKNSCTFATAFLGMHVLFFIEHSFVAEIAQLVEHDLAKVGVASSSLVFRSRTTVVAQVAEW